jgi:hypothetical protein
MLVKDMETMMKNITKNSIMFSDPNSSDHERIFKNLFGCYNSRGNLTQFQPNEKPIIFLDLAPEFNIPKNKLHLHDTILNSIIKEAKIYPYITYVYKEPITKKNRVEDEESCYDAIHNVCKEIHYIIENKYNDYREIMLVQMGKYIEYQYILTMLNYMLQGNNVYLDLICNHHISSFIKENNGDYKNSKIYKEDINRITKKLILK